MQFLLHLLSTRPHTHDSHTRTPTTATGDPDGTRQSRRLTTGLASARGTVARLRARPVRSPRAINQKWALTSCWIDRPLGTFLQSLQQIVQQRVLRSTSYVARDATLVTTATLSSSVPALPKSCAKSMMFNGFHIRVSVS
jgi:hypothetical protein